MIKAVPNIAADHLEDHEGSAASKNHRKPCHRAASGQNEHEPAPDGFDEIMPKTLATATVDRLLHHAHICVTDGQSFRLAQATAGKGVSPLPS
jgi:IstB-like ATP binding protein